MRASALWSILLAALWAPGCSKDAHPAPAATAATGAQAERGVVLDAAARKQAGIVIELVRVRSLPQVLRASGRVALNENQTWRVGAVTEGRIVHVYANAGDAVKQGEVLARMHSHMIHEGRADYRRSIAELSRLKAMEIYATRARDRARRLYDLKAASLAQVEQAEAEYRNAQTAVSNANIEVERTRRHLVEFLQIPADAPEHAPGEEHDGEQDLIPIRSPAGGVLITRNVTLGTVVQPSTDLFVISDLANLWTIAAVNEEHLAKLRVGAPVKVYVQAYPDRPFAGRIGKIGEELEPTTRTVKVRVDLPNPGGKLKPEMYATSEIALGGSEPAIFIPQEAPQEVSGETVVFVWTEPDRFEVRPVQPGRVMNGEREIVAGLRSGDQIVTQGSFVLKSQLLKSTAGQE